MSKRSALVRRAFSYRIHPEPPIHTLENCIRSRKGTTYSSGRCCLRSFSCLECQLWYYCGNASWKASPDMSVFGGAAAGTMWQAEKTRILRYSIHRVLVASTWSKMTLGALPCCGDRHQGQEEGAGFKICSLPLSLKRMNLRWLPGKDLPTVTLRLAGPETGVCLRSMSSQSCTVPSHKPSLYRMLCG